VDGAGTATDAYSLDAFGRYMGGWGSTQNPYRFGAAWGYITDTPGSGLLQLGARYYWPELGRFVQQDPEGDEVNLYVYAANQPLTHIDPEGTAVEIVGDIGFVVWDLWDFITNPSWGTGLALGADVVCTALPFVPAVAGTAIRGAKGAAKAKAAATAAKASGRLGGAAHRAKVAKTARRLQRLGYEIVAGGGKAEKARKTAAGCLRYPDIIARKAGVEYYFNIGRATKGGLPVARERRALEELATISRASFVRF